MAGLRDMALPVFGAVSNIDDPRLLIVDQTERLGGVEGGDAADLAQDLITRQQAQNSEKGHEQQPVL